MPSPWGDLRRFCRECLERLGASGGGPIPWEDRSIPPVTRYWRTFSEVLFHPARFASRMPPRGYLPAITFLYNTWAYAFPLQILVFWLSTRGMHLPARVSSGNVMGMMVAMTFAMAFISPILQFVSAGWFHVHLAIFGARSGFEATYRLTSYLTAVSLPYLFLAAIGIAVRSKELSAVLLILFGLYLLTLLVVTSVKVQRVSVAGAIFAVLLVVLEAVLLWRFVLWEAVRGMSRMRGLFF